MSSYSWPESIGLAQPAAGVAFTRRIPGETFEKLEMVRCTLVASVAVANRFVSLDYLNGDNVIVGRVSSATAVTAGLTTAFTFAKDMSLALATGTSEQLLPLIDCMLPPGFKVRITAAGLDVADQLSNIFFHVCRYPSSEWSPAGGAIPYEP